MKKIESTYKPTLREFLSLMWGTEQIISIFVSNEGRKGCKYLEISEDLCVPSGCLEESDIADTYELNDHRIEVPVGSKRLFDFFLDKKISYFSPMAAMDEDDVPQLCIYFDIDDSTPYSIVQECFELEKECKERWHKLSEKCREESEEE